MDGDRTYIAIDLKSFYASVECVERGLDPLQTNLVVADPTRTNKTICLAVSPSLKAYGISGRARLFEVEERVNEINMERLCFSPAGTFTGCSYMDPEVRNDGNLKLDYIVAPPRMAYYMQYSSRVYDVYLRYFSADDIYVYSIDEVFIDATNYLATYNLTPRELTTAIVSDVLRDIGITATAGIGTNMYLCKVAMDIVGKHVAADKDGVRIAELDEKSYRRQLWNHRPLTDFWRIGRGTARRLEANGMLTMGDVARRSLTDENLFYRLFGVGAEYIIDHAWGWEPVTMAAVKSYRPQNHSLSSGQVLQEPYDTKRARVVVREMAYNMALSLVDKNLVTKQLVLMIGYDTESLTEGTYDGEVVTDFYGRAVPKHGHGTANLKAYTSSSRLISQAVVDIYDCIVDKSLLVRRLNVAAMVVGRDKAKDKEPSKQLALFVDNEAQVAAENAEQATLERELRMQKAALAIKKKYGKNAILRGTNFEQGATARERNRQIGGHKA